MKGKIKALSALSKRKLTKKTSIHKCNQMMPAQMYARFEGFIPYGEVEVAS
jgi:hypothetical protein